jgi:hypothetical protein
MATAALAANGMAELVYDQSVDRSNCPSVPALRLPKDKINEFFKFEAVKEDPVINISSVIERFFGIVDQAVANRIYPNWYNPARKN